MLQSNAILEKWRSTLTTHDMRISVRVRTELQYFSPVFASSNTVGSFYKEANDLAYTYNAWVTKNQGTAYLSPANVHAAGILHYLYQLVIDQYLRDIQPDFFSRLAVLAGKNHDCQEVIAFYAKEFPSPLLTEHHPNINEFTEDALRGIFVHRVMTSNPAYVKEMKPFVNPDGVVFPVATQGLYALLGGYTKETGLMGKQQSEDLFTFLTEPARRYPDSLHQQMSFILENWTDYLPEELRILLLKAISYIKEESRPHFGGNGGGTPEMVVPDYSRLDSDYEAFTNDRNWMPNVVLIAKSTLVWLDQLSKQYGYTITTLDQIPDHELDLLQERGFTALWLIGLWERSDASKKIKQLCGNPEAEASAYSLKDYEIASSIGGWPAVANLKERCWKRGIRLASDMVPNHTGIDSNWVFNHPEYFIRQDYPPFPSYTFNGPDLSNNPDVEIKIEDHYYNRTDAAVTFRRRNRHTGETTYIFHGNDGTSMPWNDTAQLDFLNPITREAVFQEIRHVAQNFPIIRFDAAMTLAKKHIRRLWYPQLGAGGDIAGRSNASMSDAEFNARIPQEFWREVVDRMAEELPDTLLLAEAFWMMEGYFVRTLGMHRVYNSAFMNMLKNQENKKYRDTIKKTISFEPEILKRFVNFMNNPDEDTAIAQFGDGDKYFGVCTLLATMPGLPMFGHGQIEGYREKYGMEYRKAYWDEKPNGNLIGEHYRRIFPLLKKRYLYSGIDYFQLFDLISQGGVEESAFCYVNGTEKERSLVLYNNRYESVEGTIKTSTPKLVKESEGKRCFSVSLSEALGLTGHQDDFTIYTSFPSNMMHLVPSEEIAANGYHLHLDGYETRIFTRIHEVHDRDGSYRTLYNRLGDKGVLDIDEEIAMIRLTPVHAILSPLSSPSFFMLCDAILHGKAATIDCRKFVLTLAETYARLQSLYETMGDKEKAYVPLVRQEVKPATLLLELERFFKLFQGKGENGIFLHGSEIIEEMPVVFAVSLLVRPFLEKKETVEHAMRYSDQLLLHRFYQTKLEELGFKGSEGRRVCHLGAMLASCTGAITKGMTTEEIFKTLLEEKSVRTYVGCNEYQNVTWYKKEPMQEFIFISALALQSEGLAPKHYADELLKAEEGAGYRLDEMFQK